VVVVAVESIVAAAAELVVVVDVDGSFDCVDSV